MEIFLNVMAVALLMFILFYPNYVAVMEAWKSVHPEEKMPKSVALKGLVPFYRTQYLYKILYSQTSYIILIMHLVIVPIVLLRIIIFLLQITNPTVLLASVILNLVAIAIIWLTAAFLYFDIARMTEKGFVTCIMCFIIPPVGCYVVGRSVKLYMKSNKDVVQQTFLDA